MLNENICLVLGAGASFESGLPMGTELIYLIAQEAREASSKRYDSLYFSAFDRVVGGNKDAAHLQNLLKIYSDVLENAYPSSIDEFIVANQTENFKEITKLGIAIVLNSFENDNNTFEREDREVGRNDTKKQIRVPKQNWYQQLWNHISSGCYNLDQLKKSLSKLRILTFNYDRSLEHFLYCCALNMYGKFTWNQFGIGSTNKDEIDKIFESCLKIDHIYGQLGRLEWQSNELGMLSVYGDQFGAKSPISIQRLIGVAESIKTLKEVTCVEDAAKCIDLDRHSSELLQTNAIHFLGFGYHPQNMRFFSHEFSPYSIENSEIRVSGTCLGISRSRQSEIKREFRKWLYGPKAPRPNQLTFADCTISDYFKTHF